MIDPELCKAIGIVLHEANGRPMSARALTMFVSPYVRVPATAADVQSHLVHLEDRGDVRRHADPDAPSQLTYSLTDAGKLRFRG